MKTWERYQTTQKANPWEIEKKKKAEKASLIKGLPEPISP